jgi:hypothetical protein
MAASISTRDPSGSLAANLSSWRAALVATVRSLASGGIRCHRVALTMTSSVVDPSGQGARTGMPLKKSSVVVLPLDTPRLRVLYWGMFGAPLDARPT